MREIPLTQGKFAIVDDDVFHEISKIKWHAVRYRKKYYAKSGVRPKTFMHRMILGATGQIGVDHINGDSLDNRRDNLRLCTSAENQTNRGRQVNNSSGYKGVTYHKGNNRWYAKIHKDGKTIHIGSYDSALTAFEAYCSKAKELHGDFFNSGVN